MAGSTAGTVTDAHTATATDLRGVTCTYAVWIYCQTASRITLRLNDGTTDFDSTSSHAGGGWQLMFVTATPDAATTTITLTVRVSSDTALDFFLDNGWFYMGDQPPIGHNQALEHWKVDERNTRMITFANRLPPRRQLYIEGEGYLDQPATYATSVNITSAQAHLWALGGAIEALKMFANEVGGLSRDEQLALRQDLAAQVADIRSTLGRRPGSMRLIR